MSIDMLIFQTLYSSYTLICAIFGFTIYTNKLTISCEQLPVRRGIKQLFSGSLLKQSSRQPTSEITGLRLKPQEVTEQAFPENISHLISVGMILLLLVPASIWGKF